jgi:uncharacterized protein (DUF488 family)
MEIHSIGFTKHSAEDFFGKLRAARVTRLVDVRLNNVSQLAGFAKRNDLRYFLEELVGADYHHEVDLAPTKEILDGYKKGEMSWSEYEDRFLSLMQDRRIEERLDPDLLTGRPVLLCSEHTAEHCHRRLVIDYLGDHWRHVSAVHL